MQSIAEQLDERILFNKFLDNIVLTRPLIDIYEKLIIKLSSETYNADTISTFEKICTLVLQRESIIALNATLNEVIRELEPLDEEIFRYYFLQRRSASYIATMLELSQTLVQARVRKIYNKLDKKLCAPKYMDAMKLIIND